MADPRLARLPNESRGASGLVYVVWELTLRCDHACGHCGSRAGKARHDELSTDEALRVVSELAALGAREVTLIGGEAYLRDDWTAIARAITDAGMRCSMTTGGRGLSLERARQAKEAGVRSISVSMDGLAPAHDTLRGLEGSHAAALAAMRAIREVGIELSANTQVNRLALPDLEALVELFAAEGVRAWQVQLTVPMGRAADRPDWLLQPYELVGFYERLAKLVHRAKDLGIAFWPANNIGYYGPHEALFRGRGVHDDRVWGGCVAGKHALGLESDGTVKGCPSLPTASYASGNVRASSLAALWDEAPALSFMREPARDRLWGYCADCYYADVCNAGCTWTSHVFFGRAGNNPYCHHRALDHARRGLRERLVPSRPAPGSPFDHGTFTLAVEPASAPTPPTARRLPVV